MPELDEYTMERVLEEFEQRCYDNMNHAIETEEGLGIEYDEDVVCDVCQSPDGEDGNEMVFCDKCNICVHQVRGPGGPGEATWGPRRWLRVTETHCPAVLETGSLKAGCRQGHVPESPPRLSQLLGVCWQSLGSPDL